MADPYLKIGWAKEHLDRLHQELSLFCTPAEAYTVTREDDVEHQRHIIRLKLNDIPPKISLIVGDAIYSMRAALDQTVWSLAAIAGMPKRTEFPVISLWNSDSKRNFRRQLSGVPEDAKREIETLQPYHRGDTFKSHPLWRLDEICNLDKHRRLPAHGTGVSGVIHGVKRQYITQDATDDCHMVSVPLSLKHEVHFEPESTITVTFGGDSGITETFQTIVEIHDFVALEVLPRFDRFFA